MHCVTILTISMEPIDTYTVTYCNRKFLLVKPPAFELPNFTLSGRKYHGNIILL